MWEKNGGEPSRERQGRVEERLRKVGCHGTSEMKPGGSVRLSVVDTYSSIAQRRQNYFLYLFLVS